MYLSLSSSLFRIWWQARHNYFKYTNNNNSITLLHEILQILPFNSIWKVPHVNTALFSSTSRLSPRTRTLIARRIRGVPTIFSPQISFIFTASSSPISVVMIAFSAAFSFIPEVMITWRIVPPTWIWIQHIFMVRHIVSYVDAMLCDHAGYK